MGEHSATPAVLLRRLLSHERGIQPAEVRYRYKSVRARLRNQAHVVAEWESKGWEIAAWEGGRFQRALLFRKEMPERRGGFRTPTVGLVLALVAALVIASIGVFTASDYLSEARADARAAVRALKNGDLAALDKRLAANRGQPDFAYFFTSKATPRDIGDALATVASSSEDAPFKAGVDTHAYELILTDLAGTLALATHGHGQLALPESWTADFIAATTTPLALYGEHDGFFDKKGKLREKQDLANKANLLLLISRGYWSSEFLQAATKGYYEFDRREGDAAWPGADPGDDVGYAPAPSGVYLTDGILALTAALTANPAASEWAFTEFQPGTEKIDRSEYTIGKFTHYLLFERRFPEAPDGGSVGMTATLTALSSAVDSASWAAGSQEAGWAKAALNDVGPVHDVVVLQALAQDLAGESGCSWDPFDYWNCTKAVAEALWQSIQRWGHLVLDIFTLATFAPPPFNAVGIGAAATNATWHAIEGDYGMAGLSLAAAVPGLAFVKIATSVKAGAATERAAAEAGNVAKAAKEIRTGAPVGAQRVRLSESTRAKIFEQAPRDTKGRPIDRNTGKSIDGKPDIGHKTGHEWRCIQAKARNLGWSGEQLTEYANDPALYQLEDPSSNRSHRYEAEVCAK